jgi:hypothetical protein
MGAVPKPATAFPGVQEGISYGTPVRLARVTQGCHSLVPQLPDLTTGLPDDTLILPWNGGTARGRSLTGPIVRRGHVSPRSRSSAH